MSSFSTMLKLLSVTIVITLASISFAAYAQNSAIPTNQTQMLEQQIQSLQQPGVNGAGALQQTNQAIQQQATAAVQNLPATTASALQQAQLTGPNQGQAVLPTAGPGQNLGNSAQVLAGTAGAQGPQAAPGANGPASNGIPSLVPPTPKVTAAQLTPAPPTVPPPEQQQQLPTPPQATAQQSNQTNQNNSSAAEVKTSESIIKLMTPTELNEAAFSATMENTLPMTPEQIQRLRSLYNASQYAAASSPDTPPRPTATSLFVDLSPGATPPVIRLSQGFVTSLVFIDSSGAPWPIESYDIGNPNAFNIQWDKTSNTLMVQSATLYNYGNLAVKLRTLNTPIMLTLIPGQKAVDYRVDLRVQGYGPNATALPVGNGLPNGADPALLSVLDGVPPDGSKVLTVSGGECQAWLSGTNLYVRTRMDVISPGWISTMSSADGMHAYLMQPTPILLISENGKVVQLKIEGF